MDTACGYSPFSATFPPIIRGEGVNAPATTPEPPASHPILEAAITTKKLRQVARSTGVWFSKEAIGLATSFIAFMPDRTKGCSLSPMSGSENCSCGTQAPAENLLGFDDRRRLWRREVDFLLPGMMVGMGQMEVCRLGYMMSWKGVS